MSDAPPQTQPSLLVRLRDAQDAEAWRTFLTAYAPLVYRYCRRHGLQDADAHDVSQEVLVQLVAALRSFTYQRERGRFRDWLGTVTRHRLSRFFEKRGRGEQAVGGTEPDRLAELPALSADAEWTATFNAHVLQTALTQIRPHFQATTWRAFELAWLENNPAADAARQAGIPIDGVYLAKSRVLKRLREAILELAEDAPQLA